MELCSMWTACAPKGAFRIGVLFAIPTPVAKVMAKRLKRTQNGPNEEHITINPRLCADLPTHGISAPSRCNLTAQHHLSRIPLHQNATKEGEGSRVQQFNSFWKCLWNLKIPLKMKLFIWKAFLEILPTYQNLRKKKILVSDLCVFCNQSQEDAAHALFYCSAINPLCVQFLPLLGDMGVGRALWELSLEVKNKGTEAEFMNFIAMTWGIWYKRNKLIYDNVVLQFSSIISSALSLLSDFKKVQILDHSKPNAPCTLSWIPPPEGDLKMNVDGVVFEDIDKAGIGLVLRDHEGNILVACSKLETVVSDPEFIEATAILRGLQFGVQWGISKLLLETDCLLLVNALRSPSDVLTSFAYILDEIRRLFLYYQEVSVVHVSRKGNGVVIELRYCIF